MKRKHLEHDFQCAVVAAIRAQGYRVAAIPNGQRLRLQQARRAKREGVLAGMPDLAVIMPGGVTVWIELKAAKGRLSPAQVAMHDTLDRLGHFAIVVHDSPGSIANILDYLRKKHRCQVVCAPI